MKCVVYYLYNKNSSNLAASGDGANNRAAPEQPVGTTKTINND